MHAVLNFHCNLGIVSSLELQNSAELAVQAGHCSRVRIENREDVLTIDTSAQVTPISHGHTQWSHELPPPAKEHNPGIKQRTTRRKADQECEAVATSCSSTMLNRNRNKGQERCAETQPVPMATVGSCRHNLNASCMY